jgi:phage major head subunit gpT-like protein
MIVSQASLDALRVEFNGAFKEGLKAAPTAFAGLATRVPSTTKIQTYGWMNAYPQWREWIGERKRKAFSENVYSLTNKKWEKSGELLLDDVRDDNLGLYSGIIAGFGSDAAQELPEIQIAAAIIAGNSTFCYDGQYFFDTDHPVGNGTMVNKTGDASGNPWYLLAMDKPIKPFIYQEREAPFFQMVTDPNDSWVFDNDKTKFGAKARSVSGYSFWQYAHRCDGALNAANYAAAFQAMSTITDDEGRPLGIKPTHLLYGASNRAAAKTMIEAQNQAGGASNIYWKDVILIDGSTRLP